MKFLITQFSLLSCPFLLGPNIFLSTLSPNTANLCSFRARDQVPHSYKGTGKSAVFYILIFIILDTRREDNFNNTFSYHENISNTIKFVPDICSMIFLCFGNKVNPDYRFCRKRWYLPQILRAFIFSRWKLQMDIISSTVNFDNLKKKKK
jgi:hypothetical protein